MDSAIDSLARLNLRAERLNWYDFQTDVDEFCDIMHAPQDIDREDKGGPLSVELIDRLYKKLRPLAARVQCRGADPALHPQLAGP